MSDKPSSSSGSKLPLRFLLGLILALGAGVSVYLFSFPLVARLLVGGVGIFLIVTSKYRLM